MSLSASTSLRVIDLRFVVRGVCVCRGWGAYLRLRPAEQTSEIWSTANITYRVPLSHTRNSDQTDQLVLCARLTSQLEVKKELNFTEELH